MSGVIFTESAADRIAQTIGLAERQKGAGASLATEAAPVEVSLARVTSGTPDGHGNYPAVITAYSAPDSSWQDYGAIKLKSANGEALTNGARYSCRPVGTLGSDAVYVALSGLGIEVTEVDGSPSVPSVAKLRIDQNSGLTVSSPGAGIADISLAFATVSNNGGVSCTGSQSFGGYKTFISPCTFSGGITTTSIVIGDAGSYSTGNVRSINGPTLDGFGANGTVADGAQVINGIVTSLGSGGGGFSGTVP